MKRKSLKMTGIAFAIGTATAAGAAAEGIPFQRVADMRRLGGPLGPPSL